MALAKICDRCGKPYGYTKEEKERGVYLARLIISEDVAKEFGIECRESISRCYEMELDICEDCYKELLEWVRSNKKGEKKWTNS